MSRIIAAAVAATLSIGGATGFTAGAAPLSWSQLQELPLPAPALSLPYGPEPQQFGELRLPAGRGPFPVVIVIHGGCWLAEFDYRYITRLSAALTGLGYATWTIEFRRIGEAGGGWPNTLLDTAQAADALRKLAVGYPLDLSRVAALGHSSGAQLALWLAARHKLPADSPLYKPRPLSLAGVVGLEPITDLADYRRGPVDSCHASVDQLLGGGPDRQARRYVESSPSQLLPLGVPQWLIEGSRDGIVGPVSVLAYAATARSAGDTVTVRLVAGAGHFEAAVPQSPAWAAEIEALKAVLPGR
jgi:acetyl esterase/lipase